MNERCVMLCSTSPTFFRSSSLRDSRHTRVGVSTCKRQSKNRRMIPTRARDGCCGECGKKTNDLFVYPGGWLWPRFYRRQSQMNCMKRVSSFTVQLCWSIEKVPDELECFLSILLDRRYHSSAHKNANDTTIKTAVAPD